MVNEKFNKKTNKKRNDIDKQIWECNVVRLNDDLIVLNSKGLCLKKIVLVEIKEKRSTQKILVTIFS